jgi:DNA-binding NarL/FixJ family response regulator
MKRTIVVADRDEKVQQGFMTIFSKEYYEILYAPNGKEVEKIAARSSPDIYLVNVSLPKMSGIEVHKKLQKQGYLDKASFFFLKDEADTTELLGYQADGVIEKPINFFRVYETITGEDEVIELTDLVEEKEETFRPQVKEWRTGPPAPPARPAEAVEEPAPGPPPAEAKEEPAPEKEETQEAVSEEQEAISEEAELQTMIGKQLRRAMDTVRDSMDTVCDSAVCLQESEGPVDAAASPPALEQQIKAVLNQAMEEAANKLSGRLAPILTRYVEDYVRQMLLEITEKVIREEIDKLLKESIA